MNKTTVSDLNLHTKTVIKGCFFFQEEIKHCGNCVSLFNVHLPYSPYFKLLVTWSVLSKLVVKKRMKEWIFKTVFAIFFSSHWDNCPPPHPNPIFYYVNFIEKMYNVTGQQTHSFAFYENHDIKKMFTTKQKRYANF